MLQNSTGTRNKVPKKPIVPQTAKLQSIPNIFKLQLIAMVKMLSNKKDLLPLTVIVLLKLF